MESQSVFQAEIQAEIFSIELGPCRPLKSLVHLIAATRVTDLLQVKPRIDRLSHVVRAIGIGTRRVVERRFASLVLHAQVGAGTAQQQFYDFD